MRYADDYAAERHVIFRAIWRVTRTDITNIATHCAMRC